MPKSSTDISPPNFRRSKTEVSFSIISPKRKSMNPSDRPSGYCRLSCWNYFTAWGFLTSSIRGPYAYMKLLLERSSSIWVTSLLLWSHFSNVSFQCSVKNLRKRWSGRGLDWSGGIRSVWYSRWFQKNSYSKTSFLSNYLGLTIEFVYVSCLV